MKKTNHQNKVHVKSRQRYQLKRTRWNNGTRNRGQGESEITKRKHGSYVNVRAPTNFTLEADNAPKVIKYISLVKKIGRDKQGVNFILTNVKTIGIGAISMLLSVMEELTDNGIYFKGIKPTNEKARDVLETSGFMKYVEGKISEKNKKTRNTIFTHGTVETDQTAILKAIHDSMETVWGEKGRSPLLYGAIIEMLKNSNKHAFKATDNVRWHIAVNHDDKNNKVKFSFVDNGIGIIKSFKKTNVLNQIKSFFSGNADFIDTAYKNGIESRTGLSWRGTGLPTIYESYEDNIIKNLVVITNDVYCDFGTGIQKSLNREFSGTYYYWEIDTTCEKHCFEIV